MIRPGVVFSGFVCWDRTLGAARVAQRRLDARQILGHIDRNAAPTLDCRALDGVAVLQRAHLLEALENSMLYILQLEERLTALEARP